MISFRSAHNVEDARKIVAASQKAETIVAVAENWAYHPLPKAVAKFVQQGGIGEVSAGNFDNKDVYVLMRAVITDRQLYI